MKKTTIALSLILCWWFAAQAQDRKLMHHKDQDKLLLWQSIDKKFAQYAKAARQIWSFAELGYLEYKSSALLQSILTEAGFQVESGVAGLPTAFVATYGKGTPVIGILAEFDALPGLSQDTVPYRKPLVEGGSGHGCGHNLFGVASSAAAIALKEYLQQNRLAGTIKVFGTPAEEGGAGKVFMAREGIFNGLDAVLHWHPAAYNAANAEGCLAMVSGKFRFYGQAAHAAASPERGRSALDGLEAMNFMVNLLREHIPQEGRIHYVITRGGTAANVVPDYAEAEYIVRMPNHEAAMELWERVTKAAEGAAIGTGTKVQYEITAAHMGLLPNETLASVMHSNLTKVGGVKYDERERAFAEELCTTMGKNLPPLKTAEEIQPFQQSFFYASTDVGDISWLVPTTGLNTATWVPGTAAHTWQATATDGMSIGMKGMINAAKTLAATGLDLLTNPQLLQKAKAELNNRRGANFQYKSMIGNIQPPFNYRKGL
ncbi:MAG: amidohydrolase [Cytophagales bacterium]|nr:amidohydrolase [Bernardetiaceae bacterium]MDW8209575.1 amidohydrolase [Cytophagales bacterium]